MDSSSYKDLITSRGLNYHYYISSPTSNDKPFLLFLHGFPSSSHDWRHQVPFFKERGYGLVVPDMLGYAGTDKPTEVKSYTSSLICKDIIDILDAEKIKGAIVIGHDWGSKVAGRLANLYCERFKAFAFLSLGYLPPPALDPQVIADLPKLTGKETYGYWPFFSEIDSHKVIESNLDAFIELVYPEDPALWATHVTPTNAAKAWVQAGNRTPTASYISTDELNRQKEILKSGGFLGPLNWYKVITSGLEVADSAKTIPPENYAISAPVFFGATLKDEICVPDLNRETTSQFCNNLTVREFDTGHWVMMERADEFNEGLLGWIEGLV